MTNIRILAFRDPKLTVLTEFKEIKEDFCRESFLLFSFELNLAVSSEFLTNDQNQSVRTGNFVFLGHPKYLTIRDVYH